MFENEDLLSYENLLQKKITIICIYVASCTKKKNSYCFISALKASETLTCFFLNAVKTHGVSGI